MATVKLPDSVCRQLYSGYEQEPEDAETIRAVRKMAKSLIEKAIDDGLSPADLPAFTEAGLSQNLTFSGSYSRAIRALARNEGIREGDAALRFLYAALARGDADWLPGKQESYALLSPYLCALGLEHRHAQDSFAKHLFDALEGDSIGFTEAGTGIGKTLATVGVVNELLQRRQWGRCVVAVPTIQLMFQYIRQHEALHNTGTLKMVRARSIFGRGHFIDTGELAALANSGFVDKAASEAALGWLEAEAQRPADSAAIPRYLQSSLLTASPDFPVEAVGLRADSDVEGAGAQAYQAQFACADEQDADGPEIIYCTHAMMGAELRVSIRAAYQTEDGQELIERTGEQFSQLALQQRLGLLDDEQARKERGQAFATSTELLSGIVADHDLGQLPAWQHLVIDEAHLFEANLSGTLSESISILSFAQNVQTLAAAGLITKSAATLVKKSLGFIRSCAGQGESVDLMSSQEQPVQLCAALQEMHYAVAKSLSSKTKKNNALENTSLSTRFALAKLQFQLAAIKAGARGQAKGSMRATINYSPVREFPQLQVGKASLSKELSLLWSMSRSAACVSATLYLRRLDRDSARYMASILKVPPERLKEYPIVRPSWAVKPVTGLWTPKAIHRDGRFWLRPPTRSDKLAEQSMLAQQKIWIQEVADALVSIHKTAVGGMLVLMTSYQSADELGKLLEGKIETLTQARVSFSLGAQVRQFMQQRSEGHKSVWIAVGGAWTGLDVNGKDFGVSNPGEDDLLTDLIIPRLPFGLNRSITHKARVESSPSIGWELQDTSMRFKQGIGRLIRREGLPYNRRIFVLDGRLNDPAFKGYLSIIERLMNVYPRHTFEA